jgi:hypothetical protein
LTIGARRSSFALELMQPQAPTRTSINSVSAFLRLSIRSVVVVLALILVLVLRTNIQFGGPVT